MKKRLVAILPLLLLASGCLTGEREHTLYIETDGTVTWTVSEELIRSGQKDPDARRRENDSYPSAVERGEHGVGKALAALHPLHLESVLLRERVPYASWSTATYPDLASVYQGILDASGIPGRAWMEREGNRTRMVVELPLDEEGDLVENEELSEEVDLMPLLDDYTDWRFILAEGAFTAARGFAMSGHRAGPTDMEELETPEGAGHQTLFLEWGPRED